MTKGFLVAGLVVILTGCTSLYAKPPARDTFGAGGFGVPLAIPIAGDAQAAVEAFDKRWIDPVSDEEKKDRARAFVFALIGESDLRCDRYLTSISTDRNTTRGSLDVIGLTLSAIGGAASPNSSANWLSAGSSIAQSSRRSIEDAVFGGREFSLVYTAIWTGRDEARKELEAAVAKGQFDAWGWQGILAVVRRYDVKCGINYGLSRLAQAVAS
jgi:hypothetical protein